MQKRSWLTGLLKLLPGASPASPARRNYFQGASGVSERNVTQGIDWNGVYRNRYNYDREKVLEEALLAWRLNPLARRIVEIETQYITDGIEFQSADPRTLEFLKEFWNHPLNRIGEHLKEWSDELALTGNLFAAITSDRGGMSYLRIFPTDLIAEIETKPNDIQQETAYLPKRTEADPDPVHIPNYWTSPGKLRRGNHDRRSGQATVMLHYSVNRLAGMLWGEPDIAPLLPWLARYASWLEDRVRLNRFRQAYLYLVKGRYASEKDRMARQRELQSNPPNPGSILVTGTDEEWSVINPRLDSFEANNDGLALKKFIAGGRGFPLHWLAEPESATRTTAEAAGTPTFKALESRQHMFLSMVKDILTVAALRAGHRGNITVSAADISEKDNAALALASTQVIASFGQLWANGFIDEAEYLRVVYRFAGEVLPGDVLDKRRATGPARRDQPQAARPGGINVDAGTGAVRVKEPQA